MQAPPRPDSSGSRASACATAVQRAAMSDSHLQSYRCRKEQKQFTPAPVLTVSICPPLQPCWAIPPCQKGVAGFCFHPVMPIQAWERAASCTAAEASHAWHARPHGRPHARLQRSLMPGLMLALPKDIFAQGILVASGDFACFILI